jgi:peroxiredoxin
MTQDNPLNTPSTPADPVPGGPNQDTPPAGAEARGPAGAHAGETPPRSRRRWVVAAMAALGVALFALPLLRGPERSTTGSDGATPVAASGGTAPGGTCSASQGKARYDFTLKDMNGASVRLADYKGKVVLLNFWATWCGPCRTEIPELVRLVDEHKAEGFEVLGVSIDDTPEQLRTFAQEMKMNYPSLLMLEELDQAFGPMWALPTTFIIDRHGSICLKHMGPVTKEMVEREIKGLL